MIVYRVTLLTPAQHQFRHLPPAMKRRVKSSLRVLSVNPEFGKPLRDQLAGLWRFRAGQYRLVYHVDRERRLVRVATIAHRRDVYGIAVDAIRLLERRARYKAKL